MFETFSTTSNVVFLRSYVRFLACGRFFEVWGMLFPISGKSVRFSYSEIKSAIQEYDNIYCYDSSLHMRE